jgi:flagellar basal body-associated protein FliL
MPEPEENAVKKKFKVLRKKSIFILVPVFILQFAIAYWVIDKVIKPKIRGTSKQLYSVDAKSAKANDMGEIFVMEDIIVNPRSTLGRRFANISLGFDCKDKKIYKEVEKHSIKIRDYLISLFSNCEVEQMDDAADKDVLRKKIMHDVNDLLPEKGVQAVYFTNFVLQ